MTWFYYDNKWKVLKKELKIEIQDINIKGPNGSIEGPTQDQGCLIWAWNFLKLALMFFFKSLKSPSSSSPKYSEHTLFFL